MRISTIPFPARSFDIVLHRLVTFALVTLCLLIQADAAPPEQDSADRDYSGELPRIKPTEPAEALKTFRLIPGFRIEQVVAEPLVVDPVAFTFDENGRLFIVEMRDYSEDAELNLGRIRLLEDTDGDGHFDTSEVYAEGLSWPTALICYGGGVYVGAAPDILYLRDTDGDNRADEREVIYSGFGRSNVQGLLNTFTWGLDNRIHGATSSSGAEVRLASEPQSESLVLRGRDFAFNPRDHRLVAESGGAQHGMSYNSWGEKFVCSNSDHAQQVMFEDRYVARNPYLAAPGARRSIAADGPQADVFRSSPVEPWRIVRTRLRVKGIVPGPVEGGGTAAGYFTGSTGITIFRGTAWPSQYYNWAIVGDVGSNLVHRKRLDPAGIGYVARRVDERREFLSSTDIWFRPVQFGNAPDGALYIADMYREVIEHPLSLPPVIKKHLDLTSGRDRGRIYRIVGEGFRQPALPRLGSADTAELVATLAHHNGWHRETASRLLYERQDRSAISLLEKLAAESDLPEGRIHALYALDGLQALNAEVLVARLSDASAPVRRHAVRLAESRAASSAPLRDALLAMVTDDDLKVRYQLAFSLGELRGPQRDQALAAIAFHDAGDPLVRLAIRSSIVEGAGSLLVELTRNKSFRQSEPGRRLITEIAGQIGKQQNAGDIAAVLTILRTARDDSATVAAIVGGLAAKAGSTLEQRIAAASGGRAEEVIQGLLADALRTVQDENRSVPQRIEAVHLLRLGSLADARDVFVALLDPAQPADLQAAVLTTLGSFDDPEVADLVVEHWLSLSPRIRARAGDLLFSRTNWLLPLLDAMEQKRIAVGDLEPGRLQLLSGHQDERVRQRAKQLMSQLRLGDRGQVVEDYQPALSMKGNAARGREVFRKICAACHQLEGVGHAIAPSLATMRNRGSEAILLNVLAPNREVNPQFMNYLLLTKDGRSLSGIISEETATSVTLKRADDATDTVLRIDIDELRSTGLSLMPDGIEKDVDKQAMADLLEYLQSVE